MVAKQKRTKRVSVNRLKNLAIVIAVSGLTFFVHHSSAAGNAALSLSPANGTQNVNSTFSVTIFEDSGGESMTSVQADLSYNPAQLQYQSSSYSSGAFAGEFCKVTPGTGLFSIACAKLGGSLTGRQQVATVTFKTLAGSGSGDVSFANSSAILRSSDSANLWNNSPSGATFNFATPAPPTTPNPPTTPTTPTTPTKPTNNSSNNSGTPSGSSSSSGNGSGSSSNNSSSSGNDAQQNAGTPEASQNPTDSGGGFTLNGPVAIKIVDENGKPVAGVTVTLNKQTAVTDATGIASFTGIKPGKYKVQAKGVLGAATKEVNVTAGSASQPSVQSFELKLKKGPTLMTYGIIAAAVLLGAVFIALIIRWFKNRPLRPKGPSHNTVVVNGLQNSGPKADIIANSPLLMPKVISGSEAPNVEAPKTGKESVKASDTLDLIEKKVGADKQAHSSGSVVKPGTVSSDDNSGLMGGQVISPTKPPTDPV